MRRISRTASKLWKTWTLHNVRKKTLIEESRKMSNFQMANGKHFNNLLKFLSDAGVCLNFMIYNEVQRKLFYVVKKSSLK